MTKLNKAVARKAPPKRKKRTTAQRLAEVLPAGVNVSMRGDAVFIALDQRLSPDNFASMGGAERVAANVSAVYGVINGLPASRDLWETGGRVAGALALLQELKPADAVEGMICTQAITMHFLGLEAGRRAQVSTQPSEIASRLRKDAANCARAFTDMLAALDRKRGKVNHQTVRVERVLVTEGGALIGAGVPIPALGQGAAPLALAAVEAREGVGA